MPLDPHAKRLLDMLAVSGSVDLVRLSVNDRRDLFRKLMSLSARNVPIGRVEDRTLPGPGGLIKIRVYTPIATFGDRLPGLVYFHGGGLVAGSLDTHDSVCRTLANETGCRLISVDYRLAPEHKFPAAVMDGYAAAIWSVEHVAELGIDRDRIAVAGDSAGATLAAIVCQLARRAQRVRFVAQLLLCPITDFAAEAESPNGLCRRLFARQGNDGPGSRTLSPRRHGPERSTHFSASCLRFERAARGIRPHCGIRPLA